MEKLSLPLTSPPNSICILRLSAIGDVSHVLPVVGAIRHQWPNTAITWVCGKQEYKLLKTIQGVRFIVFDKKQGVSAYWAVWKALRGEKFDVLLHMQVAARANLLSLCIKAKIRLGWDASRSRDFHQLFINHSIEPAVQQHQALAFLSFASHLGLDVAQPVWDLPVTDEAKRFVAEFLPEDKKILLISACSSHELRNWDAVSYAQIADYAIEKYDLAVVLSGGPSRIERDMAQSIENAMHNKPINLVGKDTLDQLPGLLKQASVVISPDSGPAHIASAVGTAVIGLYACTWSKRSGPFNSLDYCVDKFPEAAKQFMEMDAKTLKWGTKIEKPGVMQLIKVEDVIERLDRVLSNTN